MNGATAHRRAAVALLIGLSGCGGREPSAPTAVVATPTPTPTPAPVCRPTVVSVQYDPASIDCPVGRVTRLNIGLAVEIRDDGNAGISGMSINFSGYRCVAPANGSCSGVGQSGSFSIPTGTRVSPGVTTRVVGTYGNISCDRSRESPPGIPGDFRLDFQNLMLTSSCGSIALTPQNTFTFVHR